MKKSISTLLFYFISVSLFSQKVYTCFIYILRYFEKGAPFKWTLYYTKTI